MEGPSDGIVDENCCVTPSVGPVFSRRGSKGFLGEGDTRTRLVVGLDLDGVPHADMIKGYRGVPIWATFACHSAGCLVEEKVQQEVIGCLKEVRDSIFGGHLVDC